MVNKQPGVIVDTNLDGTEHVPIDTGGSRDTVTTAQAIANLAATTPWTEVTVNIPAAQILTLHSLPITIVPAPGAGKVVIVDRVILIFKYRTVAFVNNNGGAFEIDYGGGGGNVCNCTGITNFLSYVQAQSGITSAIASTGQGNQDLLSTVENMSIILWDPTADCDNSDGDGSIRSTVIYRIYDLP